MSVYLVHRVTSIVQGLLLDPRRRLKLRDRVAGQAVALDDVVLQNRLENGEGLLED